MLIAIPSEGLELSSLVAEKFGRTPFIIFYDSERVSFESLRNPYANIFGGAGIQTAQLIIERNSAAVISIDIGVSSLRLLKSANIEVYSCNKIKVQEAVNEFNKGKLQKVDFVLAPKFGNRMKKRKRKNWNRDNYF